MGCPPLRFFFLFFFSVLCIKQELFIVFMKSSLILHSVNFLLHLIIYFFQCIKDWISLSLFFSLFFLPVNCLNRELFYGVYEILGNFVFFKFLLVSFLLMSITPIGFNFLLFPLLSKFVFFFFFFNKSKTKPTK